MRSEMVPTTEINNWGQVLLRVITVGMSATSDLVLLRVITVGMLRVITVGMSATSDLVLLV